MKPFSFVHVADLHLGYSQYNLDVRREDFNRAFQEVVEKTIQLKPDFLIIAGDVFQQARPSNTTLENAITSFRRLRDAEIPVLTVDGSHDSAPNIITGTILNPLDRAGLIHYLPRRKGASWRNKRCYIYGVPNFRTKKRTEEQLPVFLEEYKPSPDPSLFNIFVFHMALDIPRLKPPQMEAEAAPELLPDGFDYYAGGHVHSPHKLPFKTGILTYGGCTETVSYEDASTVKGFFHVEVNERGVPKLHRLKLKTPRRFIIIDHDYSGLRPARITDMASKSVEEADEDGAVIIPILRGVLPTSNMRGEIDLTKIRNAAEKALLVRPLMRLRETEVSEEIIRSIFDSELKDLRTKAFEYFYEVFNERYCQEEAERISKLAVKLIEPLTQKDEAQVRKELEELTHEG